jgi:hypothetical protein
VEGIHYCTDLYSNKIDNNNYRGILLSLMLPVSCMAYSLTFKMRAVCSFKMCWAFLELSVLITQIMCFITTSVGIKSSFTEHLIEHYSPMIEWMLTKLLEIFVVDFEKNKLPTSYWRKMKVQRTVYRLCESLWFSQDCHTVFSMSLEHP